MTKHRIPEVNDEMLEKTIDAAASPVAALFAGGDDPNRSALIRHRLESVAEDFDDRIIFVWIDGRENPTALKSWRIEKPPCLVFFRRSKRVGDMPGSAERGEIAARLQSMIDEIDSK